MGQAMTEKRDEVKRGGAGLPVQVKHFDELPDSALVPVRAVAILLGLAPGTVYNRSSAGTLPRTVMRGAYRVADIRSFLAGTWSPEDRAQDSGTASAGADK